MNTHIASRLQVRTRVSARVRAIALLGPVTTLGGLVWGFLQPYRLTLLHPRGQGFWWLLIEPPLLVAAVGVGFAVLVAPGLIEDSREAEEDDAAAG